MLKEISSFKVSKITVFKFMVLGLLGAWGLSFEVSNAQERGIGVSLAEITITNQVDFPYTVPITVTNFSESEEQFEVSGAAASPGRFSLKSMESKRVLVTFEEPAEGELKVLSLQTSQNGLSTGTGVKIPFSVQGESDSVFLASAQENAGAFPYMFGATVILVAIILLWHIAGIIRPWVANSNKH